LVRDQLDQMFRTYGHTFSACFARFPVHNRNAVHNMDRIKRTRLYTGAVAEAAVSTSFCSSVLHLGCHDTVFDAIVFIFILCLLTGSPAFYKCGLSLLRTGIDAHDLSDLLCDRSAADGTSADLCLACHDRRGKAGAPGISASAAVVSGEHLEDRILSLIRFHSKFFPGNSKEDADKKSCAADYHGS